jgi:hypothetical protein
MDIPLGQPRTATAHLQLLTADLNLQLTNILCCSSLHNLCWHQPHRKNCFQQFLYCCMLICFCGNVFTVLLPSNGHLFLFHYSGLHQSCHYFDCYVVHEVLYISFAVFINTPVILLPQLHYAALFHDFNISNVLSVLKKKKVLCLCFLCFILKISSVLQHFDHCLLPQNLKQGITRVTYVY